jgi:hypothetical protein
MAFPSKKNTSSTGGNKKHTKKGGEELRSPRNYSAVNLIAGDPLPSPDTIPRQLITGSTNFPYHCISQIVWVDLLLTVGRSGLFR